MDYEACEQIVQDIIDDHCKRLLTTKESKNQITGITRLLTELKTHSTSEEEIEKINKTLLRIGIRENNYF